MANLLITTQILENYGAHAWDGRGVCPQQWKAKGINDYVVKGVELDEGYDWFDSVFDSRVKQVYAGVQSQVEQDDMYFREYLLTTQVVDDVSLAAYEKQQDTLWGCSVIEVSTHIMIA